MMTVRRFVEVIRTVQRLNTKCYSISDGDCQNAKI